MIELLKKKSVYIILLFGIILLFSKIEVKAANVSINCNSEVEVNSPIKITVSGTGVQWKLKLIVDGKVIAESSELENYQSNKNISFSGTYTPTTTGNKTVKLEGSLTEFSDGSTITNFGSKTITVKAPSTPPPSTPPPSTPSPTPSNNGKEDPDKDLPQEPTPVTTTASSNNQLSSLKVNVGTLSPKFNSWTKEYTVEVGEEVEEIKITANKSHDKAKISGSGTKKLNPGANVFKIDVTAENGSVNTYTITVNKPQPPEPEKEAELKLKSLTIKGVNSNREMVDLIYSPEFSEEVYSYEMEVEHDIESLSIEALAKEEGTIVEVTGNENLVVGENIVTIIIKTANEEKSATYQIIVKKAEPLIAEAVVAEPEIIPHDTIQSDYWMVMIIGIGVVAIVVGSIIIVVLHKRQNAEVGAFEIDNLETIEKPKKNKKEKKVKEQEEIDDTKGKGRGRHF